MPAASTTASVTTTTTNVTSAEAGNIPNQPVGQLSEADLEAIVLDTLIGAAQKGELSPNDILAALLCAQHIITTLHKEKQDILHKHQGLQLAQAKKKKGSSELDEFIRHLATIFQLLWSPFINENHFKNIENPDLLPDDPSRYHPENITKGFFAELFALLGRSEQVEKLEPLLKDPAFVSKFVLQLWSARGSAILRLRSVFYNLFGLDKSLLGSSANAGEARQDNETLWKHYLGLSDPEELDNLKEKLRQTPPILFRNQLSTKIRGNSAFSTKKLGSMVSIMPGLIAWCAIVALYLLSGDGDFTTTGQGNISKINYAKCLESYKKLIIQAHNTEWYKALISTWQKEIFPSGVSGAASDSGDEDDAADGPAENEEQVDSEDELTGMLNRIQLAKADAASKNSSDAYATGDVQNLSGQGASTKNSPALESSAVSNNGKTADRNPSEETDEEEGLEDVDSPLSTATIQGNSATSEILPQPANPLPSRTTPLQRTYAFIGEESTPAPADVSHSTSGNQDTAAFTVAEPPPPPHPHPRPHRISQSSSLDTMPPAVAELQRYQLLHLALAHAHAHVQSSSLDAMLPAVAEVPGPAAPDDPTALNVRKKSRRGPAKAPEQVAPELPQVATTARRTLCSHSVAAGSKPPSSRGA
ncbi:hypothetical protein CPB84DRAFT_1946559 [Gymnopilus junonius]|uniref:Uncharacterized protein n=1 Tax=Gymnopilus junonius TaxID=109634 RepID=A0A9P5TKY6_GYMJU|nr:hypothetical protein CPB84DRAFT_1946559 [Gymnopilus junonius]